MAVQNLFDRNLLENVEPFMTSITKQLIAVRNKAIQDGLTEYLGREPEAADMALLSEDFSNNYVCYNGKNIGRLEQSVKYDNNTNAYKMEFVFMMYK